MAQSANLSRLFNPWLLHLRKMGLELKCVLCLKLLNRPLLLPCDHIFCGSCITSSEDGGSQCPFCKSYFDDQDLRQVTVLENLVSIYRSLDSAFSQCLSQADMNDFGRSLDQYEIVGNRNGDDRRSSGTIRPCGNKCARTDLHSTDHNALIRPAGTKGSAGELEFARVEGKVAGYFDVEQVSPSAVTTPRANCGQSSECHIGDMDGNQGSQTSTGSPPSLTVMRDSDDDNSDPGFQLSATQLISKKCKRGLEDDNLQGVKRQRLVPASEAGTTKNDSHNRSMFLDVENTSKLEDAAQFSRPSLPVQSCGTLKVSGSNSVVICAFCQSSKISEVSGPMLHFLHGKPVEGDAIDQPNVLHVHKNCIDWAPRVYYVGDNVVNLDAELSRGAKLKCYCCGLKGAALGCYAKSCRKGFHAPCAVPVPGCRWDTENFLMLCPTHSSLKFPKERSKSKKSQKNPSPMLPIASQQFNEERTGFAFDASNWVLCGSALSSSEKNLLAKFAKTTGATISKTWNPNVTHVLAATDGNGACSRTLKVLMGILHGSWIVKIDWLKACMEAMCPLGEEPYEIGLDVHGRGDGPKRGRLRIIAKAPKLFSGLSYYFCGDFVPSYKGYLEDLVFAAGGVVFTKDMLVSQPFTSAESGSTAIVVYSVDPPQDVEREDAVSVHCRREEADGIAAQTGASVVGHTWILESIAACELQPFA